jgi:hypothetical protein
MKYSNYLILLILLCNQSFIVFASDNNNKQEELRNSLYLGVRPLIIIFDPKNGDKYERNTGCDNQKFLSNALRAALKDDAFPIITSRLLLDFAAECDTTQQDLLESWDIYLFDGPDKNDQEMVLFVPKRIINAQKLATYTVDTTKTLSDGELAYGIKINKGRKINISSAIPEDSRYASEDLKGFLNKILITYADLKQAKLDENLFNIWDIYLCGHGSAGGSIAALPIKEFESLLNFLNQGINTRSLCYSTCYSGGINLKKAYEYSTHIGESEQGKEQKDFNFIIIVANTFQTLTYSKAYTDDSFSSYFSMLNAYITHTKNHTLSSILGNLMSPAILKNAKELNVPTIRFPHTGWFNIADAPTSAETAIFEPGATKLRITDDLIRRIIKESKEKKIIVPQEVTSITFEARYIAIPIVFTSSQMPSISTFGFGKAYFIEEIQAPKCEFFNGKQSLFNEMKNFGPFYIKKLVIKGAPGESRIQNKLLSIIGKSPNAPEVNSFDNVIVGGKEKSKMYADFNGAHLMYTDSRWQDVTQKTDLEAITNQSKAIEEVREASPLPAYLKQPFASNPQIAQNSTTPEKNQTRQDTMRINDGLIQRIVNGAKDKKIVIPKNIESIIVESRYIPIPIIIEGDRMPLIVPLEISNDKDYFFEEIYAPQCVLAEEKKGFIDMLNSLYEKATYRSEPKDIKPYCGGDLFIKKLVIGLGDELKDFAKEIPTPTLNDVQILNMYCYRQKYVPKAAGIRFADGDIIRTLLLNKTMDPDIFKNDQEILSDKYYNDLGTQELNTIQQIRKEAIEEIRKESKLPESMKSGTAPKPVIEISPAKEPGDRPKIKELSKEL